MARENYRRCRRCVADGGGGPEAEMIAHHRQGQGALRTDRHQPSYAATHHCRLCSPPHDSELVLHGEGGEIASTPSIRTTGDNQCMMRLLPSVVKESFDAIGPAVGLTVAATFGESSTNQDHLRPSLPRLVSCFSTWSTK